MSEKEIVHIRPHMKLDRKTLLIANVEEDIQLKRFICGKLIDDELDNSVSVSPVHGSIRPQYDPCYYISFIVFIDEKKYVACQGCANTLRINRGLVLSLKVITG